jgi:hypothetical protein
MGMARPILPIVLVQLLVEVESYQVLRDQLRLDPFATGESN